MTTAQTEARAVEKISRSELDAWFPDGAPIAAIKIMFPEKSLPLATAEVRHVLSALAAKDAEIAALKKEASKFAEWVQDYSNDGHIARAALASTRETSDAG